MISRRNCLSHVEIQKEKYTNAGLWLDKYIKEQVRENNESRPTLVHEVSSLPISEAYQKYYQRWEQMLTDNCKVKPRKAHVKGHMIIGLGTESVLETSVTLHRTYGVPYIPGSALKGLAANYVRQKLTDEWNPNGEAYKVVFGDTDDAGYITFFDALYIPRTGYQEQPLHPDVITVHHPKYYQGTTPPADWDSPTPIQFLSATGCYLIALAAPELEEEEKWINATFKILEEALKIMGIGAKTSSGYGRMEVEPLPVDPDLQKAEGYKKEIGTMPIKAVANQIHGYYEKWQQIKSEEARVIVAKAIIEKVREAQRERATAEKDWYKDLLACLAEQ